MNEDEDGFIEIEGAAFASCGLHRWTIHGPSAMLTIQRTKCPVCGRHPTTIGVTTKEDAAVLPIVYLSRPHKRTSAAGGEK